MTVMSATPARCAKVDLFQPFSAMSSAISCALNLTSGVRVRIANRRLRSGARNVNNYFQPLSTMQTGEVVPSPHMPERPVFHAAFGQFLKELREKHGLTQSKAAGIAKRRGTPAITRQVLIQLEDGRVKSLKPEVLKGLAALYEEEYEHLVRRWVTAQYGVDIATEAPLPAGARVLSVNEAEWLKRLEALSEPDREMVRGFIDRMLGRGVSNGAEFPVGQNIERRSGKDRRAS